MLDSSNATKKIQFIVFASINVKPYRSLDLNGTYQTTGNLFDNGGNGTDETVSYGCR